MGAEDRTSFHSRHFHGHHSIGHLSPYWEKASVQLKTVAKFNSQFSGDKLLYVFCLYFFLVYY